MYRSKTKRKHKNNLSIKEEWREIPGQDGEYAVSNYGRIKSWKTQGIRPNKDPLVDEGRIIRNARGKNGYMTIGLSNNGTRKTFKVHRLVAEAFIPNPENKPEINHIDSDRTNNFYLNLEWVTSSENQIHAYKTGFQRPGSGHGRAKLTIKKVRKIRELYSKGGYYQYELAKKFGVGQSQVGRIVRGETWKHLEKEIPDFHKGQSGENNHRSKLTATEVMEIRKLYSNGGATNRELADEFSVSEGTIQLIVNRKTWKYV